jgi:hypothetical protein
LAHLESSSALGLVSEEIYTTETLSKVLYVPMSTLAKWRRAGTGPAHSKLPNGEIRYRGVDVIVWFEQRKLHGCEEGNARRN